MSIKDKEKLKDSLCIAFYLKVSTSFQVFVTEEMHKEFRIKIGDILVIKRDVNDQSRWIFTRDQNLSDASRNLIKIKRKGLGKTIEN